MIIRVSDITFEIALCHSHEVSARIGMARPITTLLVVLHSFAQIKSLGLNEIFIILFLSLSVSDISILVVLRLIMRNADFHYSCRCASKQESLGGA